MLQDLRLQGLLAFARQGLAERAVSGVAGWCTRSGALLG
jgi:hypothetical protein